MPISNYEGSVARLHRRMERSAKGEQAKVKAEETKKYQEKKRRDELQETRKRREEKKERVIAEMEDV